jgi:5'-nucleotidase
MDEFDEPQFLLTNDDGIESPGFRALYDTLSDLGEVIAVAPADDRSAVGRAMSSDVTVTEHDLGYAIQGTPADCTVAGLESLCPDVDMVVSGSNRGANLGAYVLGRSGTVSAAVEAAFFDVPAIAVSQYVPEPEEGDWYDQANDPEDYALAADATRFLVEHAVDAGVFEQADYLNVNAPWHPARSDGGETTVADVEMSITRPSTMYDMTAERNGETIMLHDRIWDLMGSGDIPDPVGTDRRAIVDGEISVSPLTAPHTTRHHEALDGLAEAYEPKL